MNAAGVPEGAVTITMRLIDGGEYTFSTPVSDWITAVQEIASLERIGWIFVSMEVQLP